jgi:NADP-dependent 3-hydroxy acid dehydrogenase YdfG
MKAYVTGTTQGLGSSIDTVLTRDFYDVVGLNRPKHNMEDISTYVKDDFSVYVINAHYSFGQIDLLYALFEKNKHRECHIFVIGSVSADGDRKEINRYAVEKAALEKAVSQLQLVESKCKITLIKPGRMQTQMTRHRSEYYRMDTTHVAKAVLFALRQPRDLILKSMTLDVHNSNRKIK